MKNALAKCFKVVLIAGGAILATLLVFGIALWLDWPLWAGLFLVLALVALGVGALLLRKILLRRRERRFVQTVIEQDEARIKSLPDQEREEQEELQARWKDAIESLKRSHLRKKGNPLYVLPWYLVLGESGSGKTTAIGSARLPSSFAEARRTPGISGTKNCDWWFFEQAIILDTAGRYAIPVDEGRDKEEWRQFLGLLVKYRKKEPIHGLIVTVAADKILSSTPEALDEDGRTIRRRIDELMRVLGARFPVYVLVTKCDLIQGMTGFCDRLPEKGLDQPMGFINREVACEPAAFLDRAFGALGERLRNLRLLLVHQPASNPVEPGLLLFPEEFANLKRGLAGFMSGAFRATPYQETPILRGVFFSSGRQEGTPYSHFLNALGLIGEREILPGTNRGLFLHDFFSRILPADRGRFAPTRRAVEWRSLTRSLGLTSWILLGVALCGLLSFSFVQNLRTIREASREYARIPSLRGDSQADLATMDRFAQAILVVENRNRNWWIPRFGLNESLTVESELKKKFCVLFQRNYLGPFDRQMAGAVEQLSASVPDETANVFAAHLVRRINLLKGRMGNQGFEALQSRPQPGYVPFLSSADSGPAQDAGKKFGRLFLYHLAWQPDNRELGKQVDLLQGWLKRVLALKGGNFRWLTVLADREGSNPPVTLKDFWGGGEPAAAEVSIPPSFTRRGKEQVDGFVKEIETALPTPEEFATQKTAFERWYRAACYQSWHSFGAGFSSGAKRLGSREAWRQVASKMATDEGPYFVFMNRMAKDLQPLATEKNPPSWLLGVFQFQLTKTEAATGSLVAKAAEGGKSLIDRIGHKIGVSGGEKPASQIPASKSYEYYRNGLTATASVATSPSQAYQVASQTFAEDPAVGKSPFFAAHDAYANLKTSLGGGGSDDMFGNLLAGPVDFLWVYARIEAACSLQAQWDQTVFAEMQAGSGRQAQSVLSQEGPVGKFVKGPAAPYLGWNAQKGYFPKEVLGGTIPFEPAFFTFLRQVADARATAAKTSYNVSIVGLPTDTNPDARQKTQSTHLELQCAAGVQSLENFNYRISRTFQWSMDSCTNVTLRIRFANGLSLVRNYGGPQAFPDFLQDFPGGHHTFSSGDFPENEADLAAMGIKTIRVRYEFGGDVAAARKIGTLSAGIPKNIATCWAE